MTAIYLFGAGVAFENVRWKLDGTTWAGPPWAAFLLAVLAGALWPLGLAVLLWERWRP